jgi:hypothetical protein
MLGLCSDRCFVPNEKTGDGPIHSAAVPKASAQAATNDQNAIAICLGRSVNAAAGSTRSAETRFELTSPNDRLENQILTAEFISFRLGTFVPFEHFLGSQYRLLGGFNGTSNTSSDAGRRR